MNSSAVAPHYLYPVHDPVTGTCTLFAGEQWDCAYIDYEVVNRQGTPARGDYVPTNFIALGPSLSVMDQIENGSAFLVCSHTEPSIFVCIDNTQVMTYVCGIRRTHNKYTCVHPTPLLGCTLLNTNTTIPPLNSPPRCFLPDM